jgi:hypothetical protein
MTEQAFQARYAGLPGEEIVQKGLADLHAGVESVESLLVQIGRPRLESLGVPLPAAARNPEADRALYKRLSATHGYGAHSQFNSLVRRLVSFERALAQRVSPDVAHA